MNVVILSGTIMQPPKFSLTEKGDTLCNIWVRTIDKLNVRNYIWCTARGAIASDLIPLKQGNFVQIRGKLSTNSEFRYFFYSVHIEELILLKNPKNEVVSKEEVQMIKGIELSKTWVVKEPKTKDDLNDLNNFFENVTDEDIKNGI